VLTILPDEFVINDLLNSSFLPDTKLELSDRTLYRWVDKLREPGFRILVKDQPGYLVKGAGVIDGKLWVHFVREKV
jgi:hypothetical protein